MSARRAVIYARISVSSEESVSVERQIESARQYAAARGWEVVGEPFIDDGVSASKNKPSDRVAWKALLASTEQFDTAIIWKLDRLARRVLDFHLANEALSARGGALVAVENNIDMATPDGRLVANVLASFAEYESEAIKARIRAARTHLLKSGRSVGGGVPFGWRNVPNPAGAGMVVAQDPEAIHWVRAMVERTQEGRSIYSTARWLESQDVRPPAAPDLIGPLPKGAYDWHHTTVERILRHPILAGMIPFNPGRTEEMEQAAKKYAALPPEQRATAKKPQEGVRGDGVLRGKDGLPVVRSDLAVMPVAKWRALVQLLDDNDAPQAKPRAMKAKTSGVLSGLVFCGDSRHTEPVRMYRATVQGRPGYMCPECFHTITKFEHLVIEDFLTTAGGHTRWTVITEVYDGQAEQLPEIELRITELGQLVASTRDRAERDALNDQIDALQELKSAALAAPTEVRYESDPAMFFDDAWEVARDDVEKRAVIGDALRSITVLRGSQGRQSDAQKRARLVYDWVRPELAEPAEVFGEEQTA